METSIQEIQNGFIKSVKNLIDFQSGKPISSIVIDENENTEVNQGERGRLIVAPRVVTLHTQRVKSPTAQISTKLEEKAKKYLRQVYDIPSNDIQIIGSQVIQVSICDLRDEGRKNISSCPNAYRTVVDVFKHGSWHTVIFNISADMSEIVTSDRSDLI